ncbi:hypothetical protein [Ralstonia flaminis]|uniref:Transmembrane protein n=1 Tax=Ralstonia flaminis TaxID=3058597 RepID=A0ABM9K568_9RALS|nr:hypothetical protein [Ralstonia sp. LMG 18101]CAJ0815229.1 hypothetical protein LMG18101_02517 [Ralstonia sp. LMG 18101]
MRTVPPLTEVPVFITSEPWPLTLATALKLMLFCAFSVSVLAFHVTASFTLMLPLSVELLPVVAPSVELIVMLLVASFALSAAPVMSPPDAAML